MPFIPVPTATKVTVTGTLFGQVVQNVWYVQMDGPPAPGELSGVCGVFQIAYAEIMAPLSNELSVGEVNARWLGDIAGPEFTLITTPPTQGGAAAVSSPGNVTLCVSLRTALAGRRFRGRKFFSGIPENATASNLIDSSLAGFVVTGINNLIGALAGNGFPLSIVSYIGPTVTPVETALVTDLFVDSQRRRLSGRGR